MEARNITKVFPGVKALDNISFDISEGEVVALLGENGAGKSTLIKVLSGIYQPDGGELFMFDDKISFDLPSEARKAGIGVIHQELNYVPTISVAENIFMADMPKKHGIIDYKTMYREASKILSVVGLDIDPKMTIGDCSVAQKQLIEIAKVMSYNVKLMIMDEPTSALNEHETQYLFKCIHEAADKGIAVIYISHKLDELFEVSDRVVVIRDGTVTGQVVTKETTREQLIAMMVGRKLDDMYPKEQIELGDVVFEVEHLKTPTLHDISFSAKRGEIFGIYGLMGSGHEDIGAAVFGQTILSGGVIKVKGKDIHLKSPTDAIESGIGYVPAERKTEGLVLNQSVAVNTMAAYYSKGDKFFVDKTLDKQVAKKWIKEIGIKTPTEETIVESLSGGNQQKVVLAKWLELHPDVLILNEPTRGIDVGAKAEIYKIIDNLCAERKCVIIITSEMPELLAMSDRIMVMFEGKVSGFLDRAQATQEEVVRLAIGG